MYLLCFSFPFVGNFFKQFDLLDVQVCSSLLSVTLNETNVKLRTSVKAMGLIQALWAAIDNSKFDVTTCWSVNNQELHVVPNKQGCSRIIIIIIFIIQCL